MFSCWKVPILNKMAFVLLWDEDTGDIWWGEWVITFKKNALGDVDLLVVVVCFSFF